MLEVAEGRSGGHHGISAQRDEGLVDGAKVAGPAQENRLNSIDSSLTLISFPLPQSEGDLLQLDGGAQLRGLLHPGLEHEGEGVHVRKGGQAGAAVLVLAATATATATNRTQAPKKKTMTI